MIAEEKVFEDEREQDSSLTVTQKDTSLPTQEGVPNTYMMATLHAEQQVSHFEAQNSMTK